MNNFFAILSDVSEFIQIMPTTVLFTYVLMALLFLALALMSIDTSRLLSKDDEIGVVNADKRAKNIALRRAGSNQQ